MQSLSEAACAVLTTADPAGKAALSARAAQGWRDGTIATIGDAAPPDRPARPEQPPLMAPKFVKRRRVTANPAGRIALLHALAHIELNAIDLAWDIVARFRGLPRAFYDDWVGVAAEEATHFTLLAARLDALGAAYGDLPAHDGLWQAAQTTAHDLAARLAVVPLVLEARGLDVTPAMIVRLREAGDDASADVLQRIHDDEIGHVAAGRRWFEHVCAEAGEDPVPAYHALVRRYFKGMIKPPFNDDSRARAGFAAAYYAPLAEGTKS
ncbi:MAG: ferritin-like domain-containing protein [Gammaproteobacteria bacterium]|jgi:uncharacterized ferritin-like protein (DUF455 family)